jgi:hypothetical protein
MPLGSVIVEPAVNEWGGREIWLEEGYLYQSSLRQTHGGGIPESAEF